MAEDKYGMSISVQQTISRALGKIGIIGAGDTPSNDDNTLSLTALIDLLNGLITGGACGKLVDIPQPDDDYEANENERISNDGSIAVSLPDLVPATILLEDYGQPRWIQDGGNLRLPRDRAVIEEVRTDTGVINTYIYDHRVRQWIEINSLSLSDVCPLAQRDGNGLAALLATHIADEFAQEIPEQTERAARRFKSALATDPSVAGELRRPGNYY